MVTEAFILNVKKVLLLVWRRNNFATVVPTAIELSQEQTQALTLSWWRSRHEKVTYYFQSLSIELNKSFNTCFWNPGPIQILTGFSSIGNIGLLGVKWISVSERFS